MRLTAGTGAAMTEEGTALTGEGTGTGEEDIRAAARGKTFAADTASEAARPPDDTPSH